MLDALRAEGVGDTRGGAGRARRRRLGGVRVIRQRRRRAASSSKVAHLLFAAERKSRSRDLGLEAAGITHDKRGHQGQRRSQDFVLAACSPLATRRAGRRCGSGRGPGRPRHRRALFTLRRGRRALIPRVTVHRPRARLRRSLGSRGRESAPVKSTSCAGLTARTTAPRRQRSTDRPHRGRHRRATARILGARHRRCRSRRAHPDLRRPSPKASNIKAMTVGFLPIRRLSEINKRVASSYYAAVPSNPCLRKMITSLPVRIRARSERKRVLRDNKNEARHLTLAERWSRLRMPEWAKKYRSTWRDLGLARQAADVDGGLRPPGRSPHLPAFGLDLPRRLAQRAAHRRPARDARRRGLSRW